MTEHPIIFTTPMVRAILEGRKTQTRRVINPQPQLRIFPRHGCWSEGGITADTSIWTCPYGEAGHLLWVRETWGECIFPGGDTYFARRKIAYKADGEPKFVIEKWRSPYHLFKKDARLWLEVVKVRVERVQEISEGDAIAEGMVAEGRTTPPAGSIGLPDKIKTARFPIGQFAGLWDSLNAKRWHIWTDDEGKKHRTWVDFGWDQNPWVWVIEFRKIERC